MEQDRFKSLVHYVCDICRDQESFGTTKLNKILWFADTFAYRLYGKTISGQTSYIKRQYGPVPKRILPVLRELEDGGFLLIQEDLHFGRLKRSFVCLKDAEDSIFSTEEKDIVNDVAQIICEKHTAASISDLSHDMIWSAAQDGEEIPVYAVLAAQKGTVTKDIVDWANGVFGKAEASTV